MSPARLLRSVEVSPTETVTEPNPSDRLTRLRRRLGISPRSAFLLWLGLFVAFVPLSLALRFTHLGQSLLEIHPLDQTRTAFTALYFHLGKLDFLAYHHPIKAVSNLVYELPLYQWLVSVVMEAGISLEAAGRLVSLTFFFAGGVCFLGLLARLAGREAAAWGGLFYLISPFTVLYSKAFLPAFTALAFALAQAWLTLEYLSRDRREGAWWLALTSCGVLAATLRQAIWFPPAVLGLLATLGSAAKGTTSPRKARHVAGSFVIQLVLAVGWGLWTAAVRGEGIGGGGILAYVESAALRFDPHNWKPLLGTTFGSLLFGGLGIPFLAAFLLPAARPWGPTLGGAFFLGCLALLPELKAREFAFIGLAPWALGAAAVGMTALCRLPVRPRAAALVAVAVLIGVHAAGLGGEVAQHFRDRRGEVTFAGDLRALSRPEEVLYVEEMGDRYYPWLVYSRRTLVPAALQEALVQSPAAPAPLEPSLYWFPAGRERLTLLDRTSQVWVDFTPTGTYVYRVHRSAGFDFIPERHPGVVDTAPAEKTPTLRLTEIREVDLCGHDEFFATYRLRGKAKAFRLATESGPAFLFPRRDYLSLPRKSPWGCRYRIEPQP